MPKLLYSQSTATIKPYPRNDDQPVVGLDLDYLVLNKLDTPPPTYDAETETVTSNYIVDVAALEYRQEWSIIPLPPKANWAAFNTYMLSDETFKSYRNSVREVDGDLNAALFNAYTLVATQGVEAFSLVWSAWCSLAAITTQDKETIKTKAEEFNLPQDFIDVIVDG
jgi:hypothetical protein